MMQSRVLLVDNTKSERDLMRQILRGLKLEIVEATSRDEALSLLAQQQFDVAIVDLHLTGNDDDEGLVVLDWIAEHRPDMPAIAVTSFGSIEKGAKALDHHAFDYIDRNLPHVDLPFLLPHRVQLALRFREMRRMVGNVGREA